MNKYFYLLEMWNALSISTDKDNAPILHIETCKVRQLAIK